MHDNETFDFYLSDSKRKVIKGRIDFEPYARLYHLLFHKPELETAIADRLATSARITDHEIDDEIVHDVTQMLAYEHGIEIPLLPRGSMEQEQWEVGWNKMREYEWKKQQGGLENKAY